MQRSPRSLKSISINDKLVFSLTKIEASASTLCDHCACNEKFLDFEACWVERYPFNELNKTGVVQNVMHCAMHQPIIGFQAPLIGFEDVFNTIRPGAGWHSRLRADTIIGLLNVKSDELFGKARVIDVDIGNIDDMLTKHAEGNHLMLGDTDCKPKLMTILGKIYGPRIINNKSVVSVINLKRI